MEKHSSIHTFPCPSWNEWLQLAGGLVDQAEAERLLLHAAYCSACAAGLKDAISIMGKQSSEEDDKDYAQEISNVLESRIPALSKTLAGRGRRSHYPRWIAASIAAAVILGIFWWRATPPASPPMKLLAHAYMANRTFELRIPGAAHVPLSVTRAAGPSSTPPELVEAEAEIRRGLKRNPESPSWLHASGRLELLQWRHEQARLDFQKAESAGAASADFRIDFATAHFQRSQASGARDGYEKAIELLGLALQSRPEDPVALFNRALINMKLGHFQGAIADLELCLQRETDAGWRDEAQRLLESARAARDAGAREVR
jgi:tetratricopeptide (TPR) repeat protein